MHTCITDSINILRISGSSSRSLSSPKYWRSSGSPSISSSLSSSGPANGNKRNGKMSTSSPSSHECESENYANIIYSQYHKFILKIFTPTFIFAKHTKSYENFHQKFSAIFLTQLGHKLSMIHKTQQPP